MARDKWEDFSDKYGFDDGEVTEDRDYAARDYLIRMLNASESFKGEGIRAVAFDRPGMHNSCMIVLLNKSKDLNDAGLLKNWMRNKLEEASIPDGFWDELNDMIASAYWQADGDLALQVLRGNAREPSHL
jgi:hypothetical protein